MTKLIVFAISVFSLVAMADGNSESLNPALVSIGTVSGQYFFNVYDQSGKIVEKVPVDTTGQVANAKMIAGYNQIISNAKASGQNISIQKPSDGGGFMGLEVDKSKKSTPLCGSGAGAASSPPTKLSDEPTSISPYSISLGSEGNSYLGMANTYLYIYDSSGKQIQKIQADPTGQIVNAKWTAVMNQKIADAKASGQMLKITKNQFNGVLFMEPDKSSKASVCPPSSTASSNAAPTSETNK